MKVIVGFSDCKVQFMYVDLLVCMVGQLEVKDGMFELVRKGIDVVIEWEQFIFFDCEKGLFILNIYVFDEFVVKVLSQEVQCQNYVFVMFDVFVVCQVFFSDVVSVLVQDCLVMGIVFGQGGVIGQWEWVVELILMVWEQGCDVYILVVDNCLCDFFVGDVCLVGEMVIGKFVLQDGMVFILGGIFIVDQVEKLSLKEMIFLFDGVMCYNVQVLFLDSGKCSGIGSVLMVLKDSGVNMYCWQGG